MSLLAEIKKKIKAASSNKKAEHSQRFFKSGKGEYAEGDLFLGITVPEMRKIAKEFYKTLALIEVIQLLHSKYHEERFIALEMLDMKFDVGDSKTKKSIYDQYLLNTKFINNWDLVDTSASYIVGPYLLDKPKTILTKLAKSKLLWDRRIAIIATHHFIRHNQFEETIRISELLLHDSHDLIHKAVGWMLREVGKKDVATEVAFLDKHAAVMPRTMLRYAIERFSPAKRKHYLALKNAMV